MVQLENLVGAALDTTPVGRVILRKPLKITVVLH